MADQETRGALQTLALEAEDVELVYRALVAYQETEAEMMRQTRLAAANRAHYQEQTHAGRLLKRIRDLQSSHDGPRLEEFNGDRVMASAPCDVCGVRCEVATGPIVKLPGEGPWLCAEHKRNQDARVELVSSPRPEGT